MHNRKLYGTAIVGTKGQIVIPADAREELNVMPGDRLYVVGTHGKGMLGLIKEELFEEFIQQLNLEIENFKAFKNKKEN